MVTMLPEEVAYVQRSSPVADGWKWGSRFAVDEVARLVLCSAPTSLCGNYIIENRREVRDDGTIKITKSGKGLKLFGKKIWEYWC